MPLTQPPEETVPSADQEFAITPAVSQLLMSIAPAMASICGSPIAGVGVSSIPAPTVESSILSTVVEGTTSTPPPPVKAHVILEGLVTQLSSQFLSTMATCANLLMSGARSYGFVRYLLEGQVDQIDRIGGPERAEIFRRHLDQLKQHSESLYSSMHADAVSLSQRVFEKFQSDQASRQEEFKRQVEEEARRVNEMKSSDENYQQDREMAQIRAQTAELSIRSAKESLAKVQLLLRSGEEALVKEHKTIAYIATRWEQLQQELVVRSSALENLQLQLATELSLSEDALQRKASAEVERVRQEEIEKA